MLQHLGDLLEIGFDAQVELEGCLDSWHLHCIASGCRLRSCLSLPLQQGIHPMPQRRQVSLQQHVMPCDPPTVASLKSRLYPHRSYPCSSHLLIGLF